MKLIVLNGPSGIGKSTIALELQKELPLSLLVDIDALRRLIADYREYKEESLKLSYKHALALTKTHLETGQSVIVEKVILRADWFLEELRALGKQHDAEYLELFLTAEKETHKARAHERGFRPGSLLTPEKVDTMWLESQSFLARRPETIVIDTTNLTFEETLEKVKEACL